MRHYRRNMRGAASTCTRCHGTGKVLMACWDLGGRIRMRTKRCPYH